MKYSRKCKPLAMRRLGPAQEAPRRRVHVTGWADHPRTGTSATPRLWRNFSKLYVRLSSPLAHFGRAGGGCLTSSLNVQLGTGPRAYRVTHHNRTIQHRISTSPHDALKRREPLPEHRLQPAPPLPTAATETHRVNGLCAQFPRQNPLQPAETHGLNPETSPYSPIRHGFWVPRRQRRRREEAPGSPRRSANIAGRPQAGAGILRPGDGNVRWLARYVCGTPNPRHMSPSDETGRIAELTSVKANLSS